MSETIKDKILVMYNNFKQHKMKGKETMDELDILYRKLERAKMQSRELAKVSTKNLMALQEKQIEIENLTKDICSKRIEQR